MATCLRAHKPKRPSQILREREDRAWLRKRWRMCHKQGREDTSERRKYKQRWYKMSQKLGGGRVNDRHLRHSTSNMPLQLTSLGRLTQMKTYVIKNKWSSPAMIWKQILHYCTSEPRKLSHMGKGVKSMAYRLSLIQPLFWFERGSSFTVINASSMSAKPSSSNGEILANYED